MTPSTTKPEYTVTACRNCGVQLLGADDLEPGHPQPYCFDPTAEPPLFQDVEIPVAPVSELERLQERVEAESKIAWKACAQLVEAEADSARRTDLLNDALDRGEKAEAALTAVREWANRAAASNPGGMDFWVRAGQEVLALLPEEEGT